MSATIKPDKKKISVIIPTYNRAQFIVETIESVLKQTFTDYEIIVVDDGSTDNTSEILKQYNFLNNFRYFFQENKGRSTARNFGIRQATGEYLMFLDSDDVLLSQSLQVLFRIADKYPESGVVGGRRKYIDEKSKLLDIQENIGIKNDVFAQFLRVEKIRKFFFPPSTYIIRKDLAQELNGFKPHLHAGEDLEFFLRYCDIAKVSLTQQVVVYMRKHADNTPSNLVDEAVYKIAQDNFRRLEENPSEYEKPLLKRLKVEWQYKMADDFYVAGQNAKALEHYLKALRIAPELLVNPVHLKLTLMTLVPAGLRKNLKRKLGGK